MKILNVIPISRGIFRESLTYFTTKNVQPGAVVSIVVRQKKVNALVIASRDADELKLSVKKADFSLKKIAGVKCEQLFSAPFLAAAQLAADYFVSPVGAVLKQLVPQIVLENCDKLPVPIVAVSNPAGRTIRPEKLVLQDSDEERLSYYKSLVRECFARNTSVFICEPSVADLEQILSSLERGIKDYTLILHNQLNKKELLETWERAVTTTHPVLIIATPSFLSLPRSDIKTLIIDRENAGGYKGISRPFLDIRHCAEFLAETSGAKLIFGDVLLRTETHYRQEKGELFPASPLKQRQTTTAQQEIITATTEDPLSASFIQTLTEAQKNNERSLLITHRRGLAPLIICQDCGHDVLCKRCHAPVVLHGPNHDNPKENVFICHQCRSLRSADEKCDYCGSWRLKELGVGIEKVAHTLNELFPAATIIRLDSDTTKTPKQAKEAVKKFLSSPGSILLATEMAMFYLKEKIENSFIVSIDGLLALPDFRINEKVYNLLTRIRALSTNRFIVQTRYHTEGLLEQVLRGNLLDFYRGELADREASNYPPFKTLIKITLEGEKSQVVKTLNMLAKRWASYEAAVFPAFHPGLVKKYKVHLLLRIERTMWPEPILLAELKSLPPHFTVMVEPENIL